MDSKFTMPPPSLGIWGPGWADLIKGFRLQLRRLAPRLGRQREEKRLWKRMTRKKEWRSLSDRRRDPPHHGFYVDIAIGPSQIEEAHAAYISKVQAIETCNIPSVTLHPKG